MNTSISFYLNFMKFHISTPHNNVSENITRGRSPEKIVQINKHIWLSWCWLREEKTHYLHYGNWMVFRLNKLESLSPKDALCQICLKLAQRFWRRFLNFVNVFSLFRNYLPLEKVEIGPVVLEKKSKIEQVYRQTDRQTERRWTIGDQKSSLELSAKKMFFRNIKNWMFSF